MKLAIIGSRSFNNYKLLCGILKEYKDIEKIISGGAKGADSLAARYAKENNIELIEYIPAWNLYGKSAGFRRNKKIVQESDFVLAFWDGHSKGTKHSINLANKSNKECRVVYF